MATQPAISHNPAHHSSGNLGFLSAETRHALTAWTRAKSTLYAKMRHEDFQAFVRPMYLVAVLSGRFFLIAIPPNRRVMDRARNFRANLAAFIEREGYGFAGFTPYPSDDDLLELRERQFDASSFAPFLELIARKRLDKSLARREQENARDREQIPC
ncbi:MAG TPA: hypothetical protein VJO35_06095 [Terriglobales bacterium]|nr:hypothetical protein [Terriglobales bacterium]